MTLGSALAYAFATDFTPTAGPLRRERAIRRKLVMLVLSRFVTGAEGTVVCCLQELSRQATMDGDDIKLTLWDLQLDGYLSGFNPTHNENWLEQVHQITVTGFSRTKAHSVGPMSSAGSEHSHQS